jgi:two-component sensor histidine kinase
MDGREPSSRAAVLIRQRKAFADFGCYALREPDLDKVLTEAARLCAEGLGVHHAKVLEYRPGPNDLAVRAGVGWKPGIVGRAIARADMGDPSGRSLLTRKPIVIDDVNQPGAYSLPPIYPEHGIASAVNVVILGTDEVCFGILEADSTEPHRFGEDDVDFLQSYANVITGAVANLARLGALRRENEALIDLMREQQHRMRNNLQSIATHLRLNSSEASTADSRQRFETVERRVFALAALYAHLIGADLGGHVDLAAYLRDLVDSAGKFLDDRTRITLAARIEPATAPVIDADAATALGTVVNELIANAAEHAFDDRGGRIEVRLTGDGRGRTLIEVADDGRGFRTDYSAGLGLSIVRRLVARAGATLTLDSQAGRTVWRIELGGRDSAD